MEAEEKARREAEEKARKELEAKAKREAEEKAKEAEEMARQARQAAWAKAMKEAEEKARQEFEANAKKEAEAKAKKEAEENARQEAEAKARKEAEEKARKEAEARARREAEEKVEAEARARHEAEEWARKEAEAKARKAAEAEAELARKAGELARREAELARKEAEANASGQPAGTPMPSEPIGSFGIQLLDHLPTMFGVAQRNGHPSAASDTKAAGTPIPVYYSATNKRIMDTVLPQEAASARPMTAEEAAEYCPQGVASGFRAFLIPERAAESAGKLEVAGQQVSDDEEDPSGDFGVADRSAARRFNFRLW